MWSVLKKNNRCEPVGGKLLIGKEKSFGVFFFFSSLFLFSFFNQLRLHIK